MCVLKVSTACEPELTMAMREPLQQKILLKSGISTLRLHVVLNVKGTKVHNPDSSQRSMATADI